MSIEYDLFTNPPIDGEEKPFLHAKAISYRTIGTNELAKLIENTTGFSSADTKGVLQAISDQLFYALSNSYNVCLEGIGTFSVTLKSKPVKERKEIRSASVVFKNLSFRADPEMKKRFRGVQIERKEGTSQKKNYNDDVRQKRIIWYIKNQGPINQTIAASLNQCIRQKAKKDLQQLIDDNQIQEVHCGRRTFYITKTDNMHPVQPSDNTSE